MLEESVRTSEEYMRMVERVSAAVFDRLLNSQVEVVPMTNSGVDDLTGEPAQIRDEVFVDLLLNGQQPSYDQLCEGFYKAAAALGRLLDTRAPNN